jgi:hypothetical protein
MIWNTNVIKMSVSIKLKTDWSFLLFVVQHKSRYREVMRLPERENKTFQTVMDLPTMVSIPKMIVACVPESRFPLDQSEITEKVSIRVEKESQSVSVTVTSAVKVLYFETLAAVPRHRKETCFPWRIVKIS